MSPDVLPPAGMTPARLGLQNILNYSFEDGSDDFIFGSGWSPQEGALRWAIGDHSDIIIRPNLWRRDICYGRIFVLIDATPFLGLDLNNPQRITVTINSQTVRNATLERSGVIGFWIPPHLIGRPLMIGLGHLGARIPASYGVSSDTRSLVFAFHRLQIWNIPDTDIMPPVNPAASTAPAEILSQFESLGDNCEFGLVQRSVGIEPLGLFRFTATPLPSLLDGLLHEFENLGDKDTISIDLRGDIREYILTENRWNLTYHTFVFENDMPAERVLHRESQKLTLLKRRMLDDLRSSRRIYVVKRNDGLPEEEVMALFLLLNRFAPNRLLYIAPASAEYPASTVRQLAPGLVCAHIEIFASYHEATNFSLNAWLEVCSRALDVFNLSPSTDLSQSVVALT